MVKKVAGPDAFEKRVRFGCGAIAGLCLIAPLAVRLAWRLNTPWLGWGVGIPAALLCAVLARRYGDAFWESAFGWRGMPWNWWSGSGPTRKK